MLILAWYMTISILGCGWYGYALAKALAAKGVTVKGSTTTPDKLVDFKAQGIDPFLIDLSADIASYDPEFFNCDVLVIALPPRARAGQGAEYVPKLQRVVSAINKNGVKKIIFISSTGIYADLNKEVDELTDPQPNTPAGQVLSAAEELFIAQYNFKTTIIRFGGLIGPGREPGRFFAGKKAIPNGLAPVNMIHLDDCIGITEAIINNGAFGHIINACTPHHPAKAVFYTKAAIKAGLDPPEFLPELKEWKMVNSVHITRLINYRYEIANWDKWLTS